VDFPFLRRPPRDIPRQLRNSASGENHYLIMFLPSGFEELENVMKTTQLLLAVMTLLARGTNAGTQEQLEACRQQIDSLDQRIVELIQERARVVEKVGNVKREAHLPVTVPSREQEVIAKAQELAKGGPLPAEAVGRIYQKLVQEMRNWEAKLDAAATPQSSDVPSPK
jgi:chorismate mutase